MDRPHGHHSINTEDEPLFHFDLHEQQSEDNVQPTDVLFNEIATSPGVAQAETSGSPTRSSPRDVKGKGPASNLPPIRIPPGQASRSTSSRAFSPGPIHYGSFSDRPSWDVPGSLTSAASTSFGTSALRTPSDHDDFMQQFATMGFDYGSNGGHISASPVFEFSEGKGKGRAAMPTPALGRLEEASNRTAPSTILTQPDIPSSPSNSTLDTTVARSPSVFGPPPASQPRYPGTPPPESLRTRSRQTIGRYRIQGGRSFTETRGRKFSEGDAYQQQPTEGDSSQLHPSSLTCRHNRSYSSPPFSPFDLALSTHTAPIQPIPFVPRGLFGEMLPRELQLRVFAALLQLYEIEHLERISSSDWTCEKAGSRKYQWVGRSKGMRELVKFSRVSSFHHYLFHASRSAERETNVGIQGMEDPRLRRRTLGYLPRPSARPTLQQIHAGHSRSHRIPNDHLNIPRPKLPTQQRPRPPHRPYMHQIYRTTRRILHTDYLRRSIVLPETQLIKDSGSSSPRPSRTFASLAQSPGSQRCDEYDV